MQCSIALITAFALPPFGMATPRLESADELSVQSPAGVTAALTLMFASRTGSGPLLVTVAVMVTL